MGTPIPSGKMHPQGLVKLLFVLGDQLSHALLSAESKILLSE